MVLPRRRVALLSAGVALTVIGTSAVMSAASAAATRYEAENAPASCAGTIDANHAGYSGGGFCNGTNAVGAAAEFVLTASAAGTATVGIRYANGATANRPADVLVNGTVAQAGVAFGPTGAWTTWANHDSVRVGGSRHELDPREPHHREWPGEHRLPRHRRHRHSAVIATALVTSADRRR